MLHMKTRIQKKRDHKVSASPTHNNNALLELFTGPPRSVLVHKDVDPIIISHLDQRGLKLLRQCNKYTSHEVDRTITAVTGYSGRHKPSISTLLHSRWPLKQISLIGRIAEDDDITNSDNDWIDDPYLLNDYYDQYYGTNNNGMDSDSEDYDSEEDDDDFEVYHHHHNNNNNNGGGGQVQQGGNNAPNPDENANNNTSNSYRTRYGSYTIASDSERDQDDEFYEERNFTIDDVEAIFRAHQRLKTLERLYISGNVFNHSQEHIQDLASLRKLHVKTGKTAFSKLVDITIETAVPMQISSQLANACFAKQLKHLSLGGYVSEPIFKEIVTNCESLVTLEVAVDNYELQLAQPTDDDKLVQLPGFKHLKSLTLTGISRELGVFASFLAQAELPALRMLDITARSLGSSFAAWQEKTDWLRKLRWLNIKCPELQYRDMLRICQCRFSNLKRLGFELGSNDMVQMQSDAIIHLLGSRQSFPALQALRLQNAPLNDDTMAELANFDMLTELDLSYTDLNDYTLSCLQGPFSKLQLLVLSGCERLRASGFTSWTKEAAGRFPVLKEIRTEFMDAVTDQEFKVDKKQALAVLRGEVKDKRRRRGGGTLQSID